MPKNGTVCRICLNDLIYVINYIFMHLDILLFISFIVSCFLLFQAQSATVDVRGHRPLTRGRETYNANRYAPLPIGGGSRYIHTQIHRIKEINKEKSIIKMYFNAINLALHRDLAAKE